MGTSKRGAFSHSSRHSAIVAPLRDIALWNRHLLASDTGRVPQFWLAYSFRGRYEKEEFDDKLISKTSIDNLTVERVTLIARFMDSTPLRNVISLQAALANAFCYLIASMDDINVYVAQRATLYLGTIHDTAMRVRFVYTIRCIRSNDLRIRIQILAVPDPLLGDPIRFSDSRPADGSPIIVPIAQQSQR